MCEAGHTARVWEAHFDNSSPNFDEVSALGNERAFASSKFSRTALRTVETSSYAYFHVFRRPVALYTAFDTIEIVHRR